jgi:TetR/AcrR family hemagglutinin/protease transcriptional regulator
LKKQGVKLEKTTEPKTRARRMSPELRHQQILQCGIHMFAERGLANANHADISAELGVSVPTVFHYFPTIDLLQQSVLTEIHRYFIDQMIVPSLVKSSPAYERIEDILLAFQTLIDENSHYVRIWLEWSGFTRGFIWDMYLDFYKEAVSGLRKLLLQGRQDNSISSEINASDASRVIMGMAHTVAHMRYSGNSKRTVQHTVHSLVMSYLAPD